MAKTIKILERNITDNRLDKVRCYCGDEMHAGELIAIYDDHGIYAGRCCSRECYENHGPLNLHWTTQEAAENGECLDFDY